MPPLTLDRRRFLGMTAGAAVATALGPGCGGPPSSPPPKGPAPIRGFSGIRGFNYTPSTAFHDIGFWRDYDESLVERELDLARRLNLNSARVFLHYVVYEHDKAAFLGRVRHFVRAAHARAISTLPVVWDSCFSEVVPAYDTKLEDWIPNPGVHRLGRDFWPAGEAYCRDLIQALGPEPGLLMWDIMNEPLMTSYIWTNPPDKAERTTRIWDFVRHFCELFARQDPTHSRTVGHAYANWIKETAEVTDVVSFHDYSPNRRKTRQHLSQGIEAAAALKLPVVLTETGCPARSNPYDAAVETCRELSLGWYIWELMIGVSRWNDIHGIVYPDGTVRDPAIAAAVQGFFRRRQEPRVRYLLDKEGIVAGVLAQADRWLDDPAALFAKALDILDEMARLMESAELVPMNEPPSVKIAALSGPNKEDKDEAAKLLRDWKRVLLPHVALN